MAVVIERGAQFALRGSDSTIQVLSYDPGASVRYQVVAPIPNPAPMSLTEDEFRAFVIDPETGLTEAETAAAHESVFNAQMVDVGMQHEQNLQDAEDQRVQMEAEASQRALDTRDDGLRQAQQRRQADTGARAQLTGDTTEADQGTDTATGADGQDATTSGRSKAKSK